MDIVEIEPDILNIDDLNIPEFKIQDSDNDGDIEELISTKPSSNFGGGIELLMNEKNKNDKKVSSSIDIDDITNLENELNDLTEPSSSLQFDNKIKLDINNDSKEKESFDVDIPFLEIIAFLKYG